jgi:hypothetical protein
MRKVHRSFASATLCLLAVSAFADGGQLAAKTECPQVPQALILSISGRHYPGIARAFSTVGFRAKEISFEAFRSLPPERNALLIVPENEAQQLGPAMVQTIVRGLEGGLPLLFDGSSPLAAELGIKATGAQCEATRYCWDHYADDVVRLPGSLRFPQLKLGDGLRVLASDAKRKAPLVVSGSRGQGRFIYTAIPLEPREGMVFQYLPFLAQAVVDNLHVAPTLSADNLCVYFDPGDDPEIDAEAAVAQLKRWSVREVHVGAFYGSKSFASFVPRFITAAHLQGITVYAWLEYPMVSTEFWTQHPQWREVTANGHPAIMDWRYHMALEDPACFEAVAELMRRMLLDFDWDGVDFAELYFEADAGVYKHPREFTPMSLAFRQMFRQRYGVDPKEIFDPDSPNYGPRNPQRRSELTDFRVELVTHLTEQFLEVLAKCQTQKPGLQTTLTFIDALRDPTVTERYGVDPERLLALQKRFGFAVEIEDPYTVWNSGPDRYRDIGEHYRPRLQPGTPFSIDVNVVNRIPPGRPLNKPRGLELYELLANVAANVDTVTLYAFSTFSADDMRLVPSVLGAQQMMEGLTEEGTVRARRQVMWQTDTRGKTVYIDGRKWPCRSDADVLIPAGTHRVEMRPSAESAGNTALRIESVNGALIAAEQSGNRVRLTYESRGRCYVTLNRPPARMLCDGVDGVAKLLSDRDHWCVELPPGKHTVELE